MRRGSEFKSKVYKAAAKIPKGSVTTYKILGDYLGCKSYQAIGQALKRNPFAPRIPCHRVISSDLSIGGFMGSRSDGTINKKIQLLKEEGVDFVNGRLKDSSQLFIYSETLQKKEAAVECTHC